MPITRLGGQVIGRSGSRRRRIDSVPTLPGAFEESWPMLSETRRFSRREDETQIAIT
jgi:hypothetical protein